MDARTHLALCESAARATDRMLDAAREGDWDELAVAEEACAALVERLRSVREPPPLDDAQRSKKAILIRKMLANDRLIRDIANPELARLSKLLSPAHDEARLARAYGEGSGAGGATP
ncbi:MAG: flagellar protein FliT [Betaproteobacteria bacterium]|jgi:flagellar protein FliT|nr:flagellar protein FliT [Betaproteobacteria bacterium]